MNTLEQQPEDKPDSPYCPTQPCPVPGKHCIKTCLEDEETHIEDNNLTGSNKGQTGADNIFATLIPKESPDRNHCIFATTHSKDLIAPKQIVEAKDRINRKPKRLLTAQEAFRKKYQLSYTL